MNSKKQINNNTSKKNNVKKIVENSKNKLSDDKLENDNDSNDNDSNDNDLNDNGSNDNDSDSDDLDSVDSNSVKSDDSNNDILEDTKIKCLNNVKKQKKTKIDQHEILTDIIHTNEENIKINENIFDFIKKSNILQKKLDKLLKLLLKNKSDNKLQNKEKKKSTSGINDDTKPVPESLCKFLKLNINSTMARTQVASLLNNKFKELGLKQGNKTILDKKTAKHFNVDEGYVITFSGPDGLQSFIKKIYSEINV